jgi:hypothetical protein
MKTKQVVVLLGIVVVLLAVLAVLPKKTEIKPLPKVVDARNITYKIEGKEVILKDGQAQDGGNITKIFDANTKGDVNGDGVEDVMVMLTQDLGGSGTFFYVAVAIKTDSGYTGSNAVLLGDRIAPQTQEIHNGLIVINYADRNPGEPFTVQPSVGKSLYLEFFKGTLVARPEALQVTAPYPYREITSPLTITGQARGTWFFEASFPVVLTDWDGKIIAQGIATAKSDWMTENFVPFEAKLEFTKPVYNNRGTLILKKDNPSGLPQYDQAYEIPVVFK